MASVERRIKGGEVRYLARWRDPDGSARSKTFVRKRDAERHIVGVGHSMLTGAYIDPASARVQLGEFYAEWASRQTWRPGTVHNHVLTQRRLADHLGGIPLSSVRRSHIESWLKGQLASYAPGTVKADMRRLRQVLRAAIVDGLIVRDPSLGIKPPGKDGPPMEIPSTQQVAAILEAFPPELHVAAATMALAGLRSGEACGLEVGHVDFLRRTIRVTQQVQAGPGQPLGIYPPKTPASYRTIPVPDELLQVIAEHIHRRRQHAVDDGGLLIRRADGRPVSPSFLGHAWARAASVSSEDSGIALLTNAIPLDRWTPHHFRHYYASLLIAGGESVRTVQARMGHSSASITLDTYAHLWPESDEVTRRILGATASELLCTQRVPSEDSGT